MLFGLAFVPIHGVELMRFRTALLSLPAAIGLSFPACPSAFAQEGLADAKFQASLIAGVTTDYVYRGVSLSGERPTGLVMVDASYGIVYFSGLVVGNELGEDALGRSIGDVEADATIGITPSFGRVEFNLGAKSAPSIRATPTAATSWSAH